MATSTPARPGVHVRLEVRIGTARPTMYEVGDGGFLIGSVPGCDLRLPGTNLAPIICLIARHPNGASLRKLAPVQPISVNGQTITSAYLNDADRIVIGPLEVNVSVQGEPPEALPDFAERERELESREQALASQAEGILAEQMALARHRQEAEAELERKTRELEQIRAQPTADATNPELQAREQAISQQEAEVLALRKELHRLRRQFSDRYQQRRDKLLTQQQAVHRAARKVQERKRQVDGREAKLVGDLEKLVERTHEIEARNEQSQRERDLVEEQYRLLTSRQQEAQRELSQRLAVLEQREKAIIEERTALDKGQKQHQSDLIRLDRIQATIEQRQKQLEQRALEVDHKFEQLHRDSRDIEEQAKQMDEWHSRLSAEAEHVNKQKAEQESIVAQLDERAAGLESQQTMLTTLRTRLERMRDELRRQEQGLADQRIMQEATETDIKKRHEEAERLRTEHSNDKELFAQDRKRFEERRATMEQAVAQLRQAREAVSVEQQELETQRAELERIAAEQREQSETLLARGQQLEEMNQRLGTDKQALRDRETTLGRAEQTLSSLQEQVRRRSEDLNERQKRLETIESDIEKRKGEIDGLTRGMEQRQQLAASELEELRQELIAQAEEQEKRGEEMTQREAAFVEQKRRLVEEAQALQTQKQSLSSERLAWEVDRQAALEHQRIAREELAELRQQTDGIIRQLPEMELRAGASLERLNRARDQMREHLGEVHAYARQGREDIEAARKLVQGDQERVRHQELDLEVARDEHRLAVAAFRQQLSEWQGKVGEMRQALQLGNSQLELRQADIDQKARKMADTSVRLEREQQEVTEKRVEMDRHLGDMREWYRRKLRELVGAESSSEDGDFVPLPSATGDERSPARAVLSMSDEIAPADRQLGELLRSLDLVDAETLTALWTEARRQRRSLRQLLLAGGYLTLYQIALIEAGNLSGLVLGPVRVIDKLPSSPREAVYRVFDPRKNVEGVLRHLAEGEMIDAVRPDEFRQRFQAAANVHHGNVASVLEVLEIAGRPAVLLEWVPGLASGDWPGLAAAPGAWYRLVCQAALALHAAHDQGLSHGHLEPASFSLVGTGTVKLLGLGEPGWLSGSGQEVDETPRGDLMALGRIIASWAAVPAGGKTSKTKPLPDELQALATKLQNGDVMNMKTFIEELEQIGVRVPASGAAWERLLKYVREQTAPGVARQAA